MFGKEDQLIASVELEESLYYLGRDVLGAAERHLEDFVGPRAERLGVRAKQLLGEVHRLVVDLQALLEDIRAHREEARLREEEHEEMDWQTTETPSTVQSGKTHLPPDGPGQC